MTADKADGALTAVGEQDAVSVPAQHLEAHAGNCRLILDHQDSLAAAAQVGVRAIDRHGLVAINDFGRRISIVVP